MLRAALPGGRVERRYLVADIGATFGRMGGGIATNHSKWNVEHFKQETFIDKVTNGTLDLAHDGFDPDIDRVPIAHARWFAALASQLTDAQLPPASSGRAGGPASREHAVQRPLVRAFRAFRG